ncbi:MAG: hypothetical protein MJY64_02070 [archaeon]|nr:hypothetical protein [archaeon]
MAFNIPDDERVKDAIFIVMYNNHTVRSQRELANLVRNELNKGLEKFNISCERIRHIAINSGLVRVIIDYRDLNTAVGNVCPVCGNDIIPISNCSLSGEVIEIGKKCSVCPFLASAGKNSPGRYIFVRKRRKSKKGSVEVSQQLKRDAYSCCKDCDG